MITDALLYVVGGLVDLLVAVIPDVTLPFESKLNSTASVLNGYLLAWDGLLPVADLLEFWRWMAVSWLPVLLSWSVVRWVWSHIPVLGGGS